MTAQVSRSSARRQRVSAHPALHDLEEALAEQEVSGDLACAVMLNLESLAANATAAEAQLALRKELLERVNVAADLPASSVVALVGPPGVGKTTMLAKLAVRFGLAAKRSTHLISYDSHRIASGEQLRAYAAILGVGFEALDNVSALEHSLKENARKELILIDTPGYGATDFDLSTELSAFLSTYPRLDTHLVLSCAAKTSDLLCMVERYKSFDPAKLLFTRLDETESFGGIVSESARTGLPLSFLGTGPRVPEDLELAAKDRVVDLLLGGRENTAVARA
jgi:flagellar biosynthesis protein FlhF